MKNRKIKDDDEQNGFFEQSQKEGHNRDIGFMFRHRGIRLKQSYLQQLKKRPPSIIHEIQQTSIRPKISKKSKFLNEILLNIETCAFVEFTVNNNFDLEIKQLNVPFFINLTKIDLSSNLITSVQPLSWINAPKLRQINLNQNLITCIQALNKIPYPLNYLNLQANPIYQPTQAYRLEQQSNQSALLILQSRLAQPSQFSFFQRIRNHRTESISFLAKVQYLSRAYNYQLPQRYQLLYLYHSYPEEEDFKDFIKQQRVVRSIQQKMRPKGKNQRLMLYTLKY